MFSHIKIALLALGFLCSNAAIASAASINFAELPTGPVPFIESEGAYIYGSDQLFIQKNLGLGVYGQDGFDLNTSVGANEWVQFNFDAAATNISYSVNAAGGQNSTPTGKRTIRAYLNGTLVGEKTQKEVGTFSVTNLFGGSLIDQFFITSEPLSFFTLKDVSFDLVNVSAVPLPATVPLFAAGMGILGLMGWRRKRVA